MPEPDPSERHEGGGRVRGVDVTLTGLTTGSLLAHLTTAIITGQDSLD